MIVSSNKMITPPPTNAKITFVLSKKATRRDGVHTNSDEVH